MMTILTVATHEVVRFVHPRVPTEGDDLPRAVGRAIDGALSDYSHLAGTGRRPTVAAMRRLAEERLDQELREVVALVPEPEREQILRQIGGVLQAFRKSPVFGLLRPRSRLLLIDGTVGVYAQPDYWDPSRAIYEMKSFRAEPIPADVRLQLTLFQLAFPGMVAHLLSIDRRADPVRAVTTLVAPPSPEERAAALDSALQVAAVSGQTKVIEYVDNPITRVSTDPPASPASVPNP